MPDKLALGNVPIQFGPLSNGLFPFLNELEAGRQLFVIADDNTWPLVPDFLRKESHIVIRPGEVYKNLDTCSAIWEAMIACGLDRKGLVINFGGGVIGDMGGFCATSFKRGLGFIQVPTSLLAMTDAAIGGKVGVDFRDLKNILGAFEEPEAIFIDTDLLRSLEPREFRSGLAEVFKHGFIGDPAILTQLQNVNSLDDLSDWNSLLYQSVSVKVRVVKEDPMEHGLRALLNFGHTLGHALESYYLNTDEPLTHGEAIAAGMIIETAVVDMQRAEQLASMLFPVFQGIEIDTKSLPALWDRMKNDKKNRGGKVMIALPGDEPYSLKLEELSREGLDRGVEGYKNLKIKM